MKNEELYELIAEEVQSDEEYTMIIGDSEKDLTINGKYVQLDFPDNGENSDSYLYFWYNMGNNKLEHVFLKTKTNSRLHKRDLGLILEKIGKKLNCTEIKTQPTDEIYPWIELGYLYHKDGNYYSMTVFPERN